MTDKIKRKLLMALATGGGAAATPPRWTQPVVQSVILPAHAQTSEAVAAGCSPLTLPDIEVSCATDPDPGEQSIFVVEESADECPVLATRSSTEQDPTATLLVLSRRRFYAGASAGQTMTELNSIVPISGGGDSGIIIRSMIDNCDSGAMFNCVDIDQTPFSVIGTLGGTYTLTAETNCDPGTGTVGVFNISIV